jgi:hypothetical protein
MLLSCGSKTVNDNSTGEIMKITERGDFRGVEMGDWPADVLDKEGRDFIYSMPDELTYRIPLEEKDSTWYEITYNFSEDGLYDIVLEIFPKNSAQLDSLATDFSAFYSSKYGQPESESNYHEWKFMTAKGRIVKILMNDSLVKNNRHCLKINFNEYQR